MITHSAHHLQIAQHLPSGSYWRLSLLIFSLALAPMGYAQQENNTQEQSGWELSIANGLLLFKREKSVQSADVPDASHTQDDVATAQPQQVVHEYPMEEEQTPDTYFVPAVESHFSSEVSGIVARSKVIQTFSNPTDQWLHGSYQFPLPEDAAVDSLIMRIGKREIVGEIQRKQEARKRFLQAKQRGQKASLVEQQKPNMFTTDLANIAPYESIEIEIQFQQKARYVDGEFRLRFPTTYIPRAVLPEYADISENVLIQQASQSDLLQQNPGSDGQLAPNFTAQINIHAASELAYLQSPHYSMQQYLYDDFSYQLSMDSPQYGDRDMELTWRYADQTPQVLHYREAKKEGEYGMVMLLPGEMTEQAQIAREITFVIDTSSSMGGASIQQAKGALQLAVESLNEQDSFNVIEFNSVAQELWSVPKMATWENRQSALNFLNKLDARGGTNIVSALQLALQSQAQSNKLKQLVFITDGAIGYEEQLLAQLEAQLGDMRLFTVGIGSAPNSYFMVEAAKVGRGSFTHITEQAQIESRMSELLAQLAKPSLTNITLDFGMEVEMFPKKIPDLYEGEPVIVSYLAPQAILDIHAKGTVGEQLWQKTLELDHSGGLDASGESTGIAKQWASMKIRELTRQNRLIPVSRFQDDKASIAEIITQTALTHQLVSPYTSLIAIEREISRPENSNTYTPKEMRSENKARIMASMPNTAAGSSQAFFLAIIALLLAAILSVASSFPGAARRLYAAQ